MAASWVRWVEGRLLSWFGGGVFYPIGGSSRSEEKDFRVLAGSYDGMEGQKALYSSGFRVFHVEERELWITVL